MVRRNRVAGAAVVVALLLSGGGVGPAQAASGQVTVKQVPTLAQAAKAVPVVKGGHFASTRIRSWTGNTGRCTSFRTTKVEAGRSASYIPPTARGNSPSDTVYVETVRFASKKNAKRAINDYAAFLKNCSTAVEGVKIRRMQVPALGQQRIGITWTRENAEGKVAIVTTTLLVRRGRQLTQVGQFSDLEAKPAQTVKLARVALKRAR